jgi:hypothetical protein
MPLDASRGAAAELLEAAVEPPFVAAAGVASTTLTVQAPAGTSWNVNLPAASGTVFWIAAPQLSTTSQAPAPHPASVAVVAGAPAVATPTATASATPSHATLGNDLRFMIPSSMDARPFGEAPADQT